MKNIPINIVLQPELVEEIAYAINTRTAAALIINDMMKRRYDHAEYVYWRKQHNDATDRLAAFGIEVSAYRLPPDMEEAQ